MLIIDVQPNLNFQFYNHPYGRQMRHQTVLETKNETKSWLS